MNFPDSEVEPYVDVNPIDPLNLVGVWEQDRWSSGGARGNVAGASFDGVQTWTNVPLPGVQVAMAGDGTVGVTYYDFRNDVDGPVELTDL
jgi:hypothetical protein